MRAKNIEGCEIDIFMGIKWYMEILWNTSLSVLRDNWPTWIYHNAESKMMEKKRRSLLREAKDEIELDKMNKQKQGKVKSRSRFVRVLNHGGFFHSCIFFVYIWQLQSLRWNICFLMGYKIYFLSRYQ